VIASVQTARPAALRLRGVRGRALSARVKLNVAASADVDRRNLAVRDVHPPTPVKVDVGAADGERPGVES
jgi:hypothetical protein